MTEDEKLKLYQSIQGVRSENPPKKVQKAVFPNLEQLYHQKKLNRTRSARFGFSRPGEGDALQKTHFDVNPVAQAKPTPIRRESIPIDLQRNLGLFKSKEKGNRYRKAAKFLLLIDKESAAQILKQFSEEEVQLLTAEIATIHQIDPNEAKKIMDEFKFIKARQELPQGGMDVARSILVSAFGEEEGRKKLLKAIPFEMREKPFDFLKDLEPIQVNMVLKKESAMVLATVIPFLTPALQKNIFMQLDPHKRVEVTKRIAKCQKLNPDAMKAVETTLKEKVRTQGRVLTEAKDGKAALAGILKYMSIEDENQILSQLEADDEQLYTEVKDKLFTIDMIEGIEDVEFQKILASYSDEDLAVLVKGKTPAIENKILNNVSPNRRQAIEEERSFLGEMKRSDVDEKTKAFVADLRQLAFEGKIYVANPNDKWI